MNNSTFIFFFVVKVIKDSTITKMLSDSLKFIKEIIIMKKNISEKELAIISGGKGKDLTMVYRSKGFIKEIIGWFKH